MLEKFEKFNERLSAWGEWIAFWAIFFMVVLTCVDVLGSKLFRTPVFGSIDVMMLAQLIAVSFAAAMALIQNRHVQVEFFVMLLPRRIQALIDGLIQLLCLGLFVLIVWRLFAHGYYLHTGSEETSTAHIPMAPFAYASAVGIIPVCLVLLQQFFTSILRLIRNES
jgi:TRAP-type C4-dicarboxylate transport system permease small subunit